MFLLKLLAAAHGLFGLFILALLWLGYSQGTFEGIVAGRATLKIAGTVLGGLLLLACAWAAWKYPSWSAPFAWAALAAFVISAAGDEVYLHGVRGLANLMPTFYVAVLVRAAAALSMTLLGARVAYDIGGR